MKKISTFHSSRFLILFFEYIVCWAILLLTSFLLKRKVDLDNPYFYLGVFMIPFVHACFFAVFRTHITVLRFTSYRDIFKIWTALSSSMLLIFVISNLFKGIYPKFFFSNFILVLSYFISLFSIVLYRLLTRYIITRNLMSSRNLVEKRIALIGTDYQSIITKHYLDYERAQYRYIITAYFTKDDSLMNKTIEGAPVYHIQKISTMLDIIKIDSLILVAEKGYNAYLPSIKEICLQKNIKFIESNQLKNWVDLNDKANLRVDFNLEKLLQRPPIKLDIQRIKYEIEGKVILITGAAGSIGAEICRQVAKYSPSQLVLLDQAESPLFEIENELREKSPNLISFIADISDHLRMSKIIENTTPDIIFHAAAYKHVPLMENHPYEAVKTNILGTKNLVDLAIRYRCKKLVMISTDKAVNPTNVMGATKRAAELYVQLMGEKSSTRFITTRFGNVLGSNGSVIPVFKNQIESGGPIKVTHPEITRFFMTIPEACQLVLEAGTYGEGNEIFLFDMGQPVKILDLAKNMISMYGLKEDQDIKIEFIGLRPGEKLYEELLADEENTIPTHHEKILKAKHAVQNSIEIQEKWNRLLESFINYKGDQELVKSLKSLVPEFKSNNSEFEILDQP